MLNLKPQIPFAAAFKRIGHIWGAPTYAPHPPVCARPLVAEAHFRNLYCFLALALCILHFLCFPTFAVSISPEGYLAVASKSTMAYLRWPASARATALGGAVAAAGLDDAAPYVNPGLAGQCTTASLSATYRYLTLDRKYYFAGAQYPFRSSVSAIGMGWIQYGVDEIERRNANGVQDGTFDDLENTIALWYGGGLGKKLLLGLSAKYHMHSLDSSKAMGYSADAGMFFQATDYLKLALVGHDLGYKFTWDTEHSDRFAPGVRVGIAAEVLHKKLLISSDGEWTPGNSPQAYLGLEGRIVPQFAVRLGGQGPNPILGAAGFGVHVKMVAVDYAFEYHESGLGHSHVVSLVISLK